MLVFKSLDKKLIKMIFSNTVNGQPATRGGGLPPPLDLKFLLLKNGFSDAPQTSQVPNTPLLTNFGEKTFWSYDPPRTP